MVSSSLDPEKEVENKQTARREVSWRGMMIVVMMMVMKLLCGVRSELFV